MSTQRFKVSSPFDIVHPQLGRIMFETGSVFGVTEKDNGYVIVDVNDVSYVFEGPQASAILTFVQKMLTWQMSVEEEHDTQDEVSVYDLFDEFKATLAGACVEYENVGLVEEGDVTYFCVKVGDEVFSIEAGDDVISLLSELAQYYTLQSQYEKTVRLVDYIISVSK